MRESEEAENDDEEPLATSGRRSRTAQTKAKRQLEESKTKTRADSEDMETSFTQDKDVLRVDAMSPFDQEDDTKRPEEATPSPAKRPKSPKKGAQRKTTRRGR